MTLVEAFAVMIEAGYTHALDEYSRFPRDIRSWLEEAKADLNDYSPNVETGEIVQNHPRPSNYYMCSRSPK